MSLFAVESVAGEAEEDGFEEDYPLEDLEVTPADFMVKMQVPDFRASWEEMGNDNEVMAKFALEVRGQVRSASVYVRVLDPCCFFPAVLCFVCSF